jgi:hypothetical protein
MKNTENNCRFKCNLCDKEYKTKQSLNIHIENKHRKDIKLQEYEKHLEKQKKEYEKNLEKQKKEYEKKLEEYKKQIEKLQDKLENVAIKAATKPTTQQTNYIQNNLQPLTNADFTKYLDKLTANTLINGYEGLGKYALEYPLNNRVICVDFSRKIVKFKNEAGELVNDPEMTDICERFFDSITDKSKNISNNIDNHEDDVYKGIFSNQVSKIAKEIRFTGEGYDTQLKRDFVNYICKRVKS